MDSVEFSKASVIAIVLMVALAGPAVYAQSQTDALQQDPSDVEIDPELESRFEQASQGLFASFSQQNTEKIEVMVGLQPYRTPPNNISDMKSKASKAQAPIMSLAENSPKVRVKNNFWITNAVLLEVETNFPIENIAGIKGVKRLQQNTGISMLQRPSVVSSSGVSTQNTGNTYGLDQINATETWNQFGARGDGVKVAVLDTGVDQSHPDIEISDENWKDFVYDNQSAVDHQYHGTHVSGTIIGGGSSGTRIGVAPNATLMHAAILDEAGNGFSTDILEGMQWAVENNADIISMSLGMEGGGYDKNYISAIENAISEGVIVIAASGNNGETTSSSPANVYDAFAVGASAKSQDITAFSSGEKIDTTDAWENDAPDDWPSQYIVPDIAAPGNLTFSAFPENFTCNNKYGEVVYEDHCYLSGTSMATPHVSGAAALMQSATDKQLNPNEVMQAFTETAWKPGDWDESEASASSKGKDSRYGEGIIDAYAATEYAVDHFDTGFEIRDVKLNTSSVNVTKPFNVSGEIENFDGQAQDISLNLTFNETINYTQNLEIAADEIQEFEFIANISEEGFYNVKVNDKPAGGIDVIMPDPDFSITSELQNTEIIEGELALINGTITNNGGEGVAELKLISNGSEVDSQSLNMGFESTESYNFTKTFDNSGDYNLAVKLDMSSISALNDQRSTTGSLNVLKDAELRVNSLEFNISNSKVFENTPVNISVQAENIGDIEESFNIKLLDNNAEISQISDVTISPGSIKTVNFTESFSRGNHSISVGEASKELEVLKPGSIEIIDTALSESEMVEGNKVVFNVSVENPGDVVAEGSIIFKENGSEITENSISLGPGKRNISFIKVFDTPGDYELSANNTETEELSVLKAADVNIGEIDFSLASVFTGQPIEIRASISNAGEIPGNTTLNFSAGPNSTTAVEEVEPGETSFNQTLKLFEPGNYTVEVNKTAVLNESDEPQILTVKKPFVNITHITGNVSDRGLVTIEAALNNTDPGYATETLGLVFNSAESEGIEGWLNEKPEFNLAPNEGKNVSFETTWFFPGKFNYSVNSTYLGQFELNTSAEFSNLEPESKTFEHNEEVQFSGVVDVISNISRSHILEVRVDGEKVFENQTAPGENKFEFSESFDSGEHEWQASVELHNSTFESPVNSFEVEEEETPNEEEGLDKNDPESSGAGAAAPVSEPELEIKETKDRIHIHNIYEAQSLSFNNTDLPLKGLEFDSDPDNGTITFKASNTGNETVSFESVVAAVSSFESSFTLNVSVSRKWMEDNRFKAEEIKVYDAQTFEDLNAELIEEKEDEIIYSMKLQNVSDFGIGADRACYSMEAVEAASSNSCKGYSNPCEVPEEREIVDGCGAWNKTQELENQINNVREQNLGSEQVEKLDEALNALEGGDSSQAERVLEEIEKENRNNLVNTGIIVFIGLGILALSAVLGWKVYLRRKRRNALSRVEDLTDRMKAIEDDGIKVKDLAIQLKQANQSIENRDYDSTEELCSKINKVLEERSSKY